MIRLLVTADDLGHGPGRDRGILEAFERGIVTGASLLANGRSFAEAARQARRCGLPVGVHLNLSEGRPLSGPIAGLTELDGSFPGKLGLRQRLAASGFPLELAGVELTAQIDRVLQTGLVPEHLNSHQHFALFPAACQLLLELTQSFGIGALRLPLPLEPAAADPGGELGTELALYRRLAPAAASLLRASGLRTPDGLLGMPLLDRFDPPSLAQLLATLPNGTWELMTHPGYPDPGQEFSGPERQKELTALTDPAIRALIARRGIQLVSFGDLACAS